MNQANYDETNDRFFDRLVKVKGDGLLPFRKLSEEKGIRPEAWSFRTASYLQTQVIYSPVGQERMFYFSTFCISATEKWAINYFVYQNWTSVPCCMGLCSGKSQDLATTPALFSIIVLIF